jgi:hypothetical protein
MANTKLPVMYFHPEEKENKSRVKCQLSCFFYFHYLDEICGEQRCFSTHPDHLCSHSVIVVTCLIVFSFPCPISLSLPACRLHQLEAHAALHALHRAFVQSLNDATAPLIAAANAKQTDEEVHGGTGWRICFIFATKCPFLLRKNMVLLSALLLSFGVDHFSFPSPFFSFLTRRRRHCCLTHHSRYLVCVGRDRCRRGRRRHRSRSVGIAGIDCQFIRHISFKYIFCCFHLFLGMQSNVNHNFCLLSLLSLIGVC